MYQGPFGIGNPKIFFLNCISPFWLFSGIATGKWSCWYSKGSMGKTEKGKELKPGDLSACNTQAGKQAGDANYFSSFPLLCYDTLKIS